MDTTHFRKIMGRGAVAALAEAAELSLSAASRFLNNKEISSNTALRCTEAATKLIQKRNQELAAAQQKFASALDSSPFCKQVANTP